MTLIGAILKKVKSKDSIKKKYSSPPPEIKEIEIPKKEKRVHHYSHVSARVDSSPPRLDPMLTHAILSKCQKDCHDLYVGNLLLLMAIKRMHFSRGRVDSRWGEHELPKTDTQYFDNRVQQLKRIQKENVLLYKRIICTMPRVATTAFLRSEWRRNRSEILLRARNKFVLFPPVPHELIEDVAFRSPQEVQRERAHLTLRIRGGAVLGSLTVELFTDVCPLTCKLFLELLDGDGLGHGYVGTTFFRKVPNLYWSGGDVVHDNGFGCYAQRGRRAPIGAENYHFPHSMPGLLSMRMTRNDEMCGIFNITFKPLPQFDLRNVVFGRVVRPSDTYNMIQDLGSPLSVHPVVELIATRRKVGRRWVCGAPNTVVCQTELGYLRKLNCMHCH